MTTIDTPEGIRMFGLLQVAHLLALEINTGMKYSNAWSPLAIAQKRGLTHKRTKRGALKDVIAVISAEWPKNGAPYTPSASMLKALGR